MAARFQRLAPVFPVRDVTAALAHYRRLGFEGHAYEVSDACGPIYGFVKRDEIEIHLSRVSDLDPKANTSACYVYIDDADSLYAEWRAQAGGHTIAPRDTDYGLRELAHVDPDGNLLRVGSPI
jgi:catechol 2,3-dioxygenase-like lactoylglutathione lyase family enzyme